ncbi:MAG TPA: FtsX-like permease family protein [Candidatus Saccharimonadales bacterium]|nr:FtsX-like permease family protein [Candidatus Saccharimonadales bacterium]
MGTIIRGIKNAFRNSLRTLSVVLILALSIGLALIMLLSYQTVKGKIASVQGSIGNTITVTPAGAQGFQGGGEPLTTDQVTTVSQIANVTKVTSTLQDRLTAGTDTNLVSAIDAGTLGNRFRDNSGTGSTTPPSNGSSNSTRTFTPPITVSATTDPNSLVSGSTTLTSGALFDAASTDNVAIVGSALATKNNLTVGSTFTAYSKTVTVVGIFDAGNEFANAGMYMPMSTLQTLSNQAGQVSEAVVTVNTIGNVDSTVAAIKDKLGTTVADVTSDQSAAQSAIAPLENIKSISLYSLTGSLLAGAVITLLIMMMIVRERKREIGVLKAIGSSNVSVVMQFVYESLVLTIIGAAVGVILGVLLSNPVLKVLVNNSTSTATTATGGRGFARIAQVGGQFGGNLRGAVSNLHATVGTSIILYGLLAAVVIAIVGSAIPAFLIAKVRPAEAMRAE